MDASSRFCQFWRWPSGDPGGIRGDTLREKFANGMSIPHHPVRLVSGAAPRDMALETGHSKYSHSGAL
jgi:hypothetical protein